MLAVIAGYGYYEMGQISAEVRDVIEGPIASITLGVPSSRSSTSTLPT